MEDHSELINVKNIPPVLKLIDQWVNWIYEERNGKLTKPPINPKYPAQYADTTRPETWGTFQEAYDVYKECENERVAGIGVVLKRNGIIAIDLDHCIENGSILPWAERIINKLNSYTEKTPSGEGLRVYVKGELPFDGREKKDNGIEIEIYQSKRYLTVTGHHVEGFPLTIEDRQSEIEAICKEIWGEGLNEPKVMVQFDTPPGLWRQAQREIARHSRIMLHFLNPKPDDRSGHDWRLACLCLEEGITDPAMLYQVILNNPHGKARSYPDSDRYIRDLISRCLSQSEVQINSNNRFPIEAVKGLSQEFADLYASYLESPWSFFAFSFLTCLGNVLANRLTLDSEIAPQPRLFTFLLGESADDRKSECIKQTVSFFSEALGQSFAPCFGVGSAEGLSERLKIHPQTLLVFDEAKVFVAKSSIESSVLLPCVNTLFESNRFHSHTKGHSIELDPGYLSILAASTKDTYQRMWTPAFLDIGFINRLWLVPDKGERKFSIPQSIPRSKKEALKQKLISLLGAIPKERTPLKVTQEALQIFTEWYETTPRSIFTKRLDTYGHRLMILFCANENTNYVSPDIAQRVVSLLQWQIKARVENDPIEAESKVAKMEEAIRRALVNGPMTKRQLQRKTHYNRTGLFVWNNAIRNLIEAKEIFFNPKGENYSLGKGVF